MRVFEIITILSVLGIIIDRMIRRNRSHPIWGYGIAIPAVLHIVLEGARWQMFGIYAIVILIIFCHAFADLKKSKKALVLKKWPYIVGISIALLSLLLIYLFPVKDMIKPTGPYNVGTMTYDLSNNSRIELYGERKGDSRKIRIQLWYPTNDDITGDIAPWIEDGTIVPRGYIKEYNAPSFLFDQITLIDSNSHMDAPLRNDIPKMPVVIISHGWTGFRNLHTDLGELFASMGYIAISIDHTYGSIGLVFDDGETATVDPGALPDRDKTDSFLTYAGNLVDTYSKDTKDVIDHLIYLNNWSNIFKGHIDLELIGVIGHSTGGGGVVKQAIENPMVDAVIGLDPWVEPIGEEMLEEGLNQPAMFFRSTSWVGGINEDYIKILVGNESSEISSYEIAGSQHSDFSMLYQMGPLPGILGISGELNGFESAEIQQAFIANFMNHYLLEEDDKTSSLLNDYESVSEVKYDGK